MALFPDFLNTPKLNYSSIGEYFPIKIDDYNKYDEFYHFLCLDFSPHAYSPSYSVCCLTRGFHPCVDFENVSVLKGNECLKHVLFPPEFKFYFLNSKDKFDSYADKLFDAIRKIDKVEKLHCIRIDVFEAKLMYEQIKIFIDALVKKITHYDKSIKIIIL